MDDFMPFGLEFNSYSRENSVENRYLYNQGTGDKAFRTERQFDLGLNVDQSRDRTYDYITGRWWQLDPKADEEGQEVLSPYHYSYNNPVRYNDPYGDCPTCDPFFNAGVAVGAFDALKSTVSGAVNFLTSMASPAGQVEMAVSTAMTVQAIVDNPGAVVDGVVGDVKSTVNTLVNGSSFEQGQIVGGTAVVVADIAVGTKGTGILKTADKVSDVVPTITKAYSRPNNATTVAQRTSVQGKACVDCGKTGKMVADHKKPLVKEYYETGKIDKQKMRDVKSVQPQCETCSGKQGAELKKYSQEQKKKHGLN